MYIVIRRIITHKLSIEQFTKAFQALLYIYIGFRVKKDFESFIKIK